MNDEVFIGMADNTDRIKIFGEAFRITFKFFHRGVDLLRDNCKDECNLRPIVMVIQDSSDERVNRPLAGRYK